MGRAKSTLASVEEVARHRVQDAATCRAEVRQRRTKADLRPCQAKVNIGMADEYSIVAL